MAAGSTLNDAVKYVLSGLTFCRGKFTVAKKGDKTCVPKQQMLQLFQKLEDVATKKWSQNMLTTQRAIFWTTLESPTAVIDKVRSIVYLFEPGI